MSPKMSTLSNNDRGDLATVGFWLDQTLHTVTLRYRHRQTRTLDVCKQKKCRRINLGSRSTSRTLTLGFSRATTLDPTSQSQPGQQPVIVQQDVTTESWPTVRSAPYHIVSTSRRRDFLAWSPTPPRSTISFPAFENALCVGSTRDSWWRAGPHATHQICCRSGESSDAGLEGCYLTPLDPLVWLLMMSFSLHQFFSSHL
jgi:hypothetical protein